MAAGIGEAASIIALVQITEEIVKICGAYLSDVRHAQRDIERILEKVSDLKDVLVRLRQKRSSSVDAVRVQQCYNDVVMLQKKIGPSVRRTTMKKMGLRALKWPLQKGAIEADVKMLDDYLQFFSLAVQLDIQDQVGEAARDRSLDKLAFVGDAVFNSYENDRHRQCLEGTRVDVLNEINTWASTTIPQCIFWLKGMAGTGKSTVALTTAHRYSNTPSFVTASYFFKKGAGDLAYSRKLLPTLVHQMARQSRSFCDFLLPVLQSDPIIGHSAKMKDQFDKLLMEPLRRLEYGTSSKDTFIWILDALDECDDKSDIQLLLRLIAQARDIQKLRLRVFVTSRPDIPIQDGFRDIPNILHHDLILHEVSRPVVDKDIALFFTHELEAIRIRRHLPKQWPSIADVQCLVSRAAGLFVFASTACLYIGGARRADPQRRLQQVCSITTDQQVMTKKLDQMYTIALQESVEDEDYSEAELEETMTRFRRIVGPIILLSDPLSVVELHKLLSDPSIGSSDVIEEALRPLHAVIDVPAGGARLVRILHLSFRDFLLSRERCTDSRFWIDRDEVHQALFLGCIQLMSRLLHRKICVPSPRMSRHDAPAENVDQIVSPALQYACRYWIEHARHVPEYLTDDGPFHIFLKKHTLNWLMVMSTMGRTAEAVQIVTELTTLLAAKPRSSARVSGFLQDLQRFVLHFRRLLAITPYQVYISALLFCPRESIMRKAFDAERPLWAMFKPEVANSWGSCRSTLEGHTSAVGKAVFSSDGQILASGSDDSTVRLWDAQTGERRSVLMGHTNVVTAVAFSFDSERPWVASGSLDKTVRIWDVGTGECYRILSGHSGGIEAMALSPKGKLLVSGSSDQTLRLWDTQTGECRSILQSAYGWAYAMAFSPNGQLVASGTRDALIKLWDVRTGECVHNLGGHQSIVYTVEFSTDGKTIASASWDDTIRLWNSHTGECLHVLIGHTKTIKSVAFSFDGKTLASGSGDTTIRVWDVKSGKCRHILRGHTAMITAVLFSPGIDRQLLASGSVDKTIRLWDTQTGTCRGVLEGHAVRVNALAFPPNGQILASCSVDGTVRLWDVHATHESNSPLSGYSSEIRSISFSPDGATVASGAIDGAIRLWDSQTGKCRHTFEGHPQAVFEVTFSPDGQTIASACRDSVVGLWDIQTGDCRKMLAGHTEYTYTLAFSPDGRILASGSHDKTIRLWDPQTGDCRRVLRGDAVNLVRFSPNGEILASGSDEGTVRLWDPRTGVCQMVMQSKRDDITSLVFSPNGQELACGSRARTVTLWDVSSGGVLTTRANCHPDAILGFAKKGHVLTINGVDVPFKRPLHSANKSVGREGDDTDEGIPSICLDANKEWVAISGKCLLWLPSEYRPQRYAINGNTVALGTGSGRIVFVHFDLHDPGLKAYIKG